MRSTVESSWPPGTIVFQASGSIPGQFGRRAGTWDADVKLVLQALPPMSPGGVGWVLTLSGLDCQVRNSRMDRLVPVVSASQVFDRTAR